MLLFASLATLLVIATLALLLIPLLRHRRAREAPDADAAAAAVYRDQKHALDAEYADGVISVEEREAAMAELAHRLAEDVGRPRERAAPALPRRSAWVLAVVLLVVIPAVAVVLYSRLGKPDAIVPASDQAVHDLTDQQVNGLVDTLAQRLKARPDDAEGWVLLARSYRALERWNEAAAAYAHATELVPDDPSLLADYADVLAVAQGRRLEGKPAALAARALALDPNHRKALALAATAAMETRDYDGAIALWQRLRAQFPQGSEDAKQVTSFIAEVEDMKRHPDAATETAAASRARAAPPPAAPREAPPTAATPAAGIAGRVEVASALASKVALTDTVFIYARAAEGPRMPLAVLRIPAKDLPTDYRLDDSMGMAGAKLSTAPSVVVEARISKSGNAIPQAGDLSGRSGPVKPGASGVNITIDQVVP
ncbi:MAG TPA: c-type cytochrome biogenesis protein CcmI [Casimicrobiaceae bacterium]|nr:c-type cytochrome biogenesis protein CcmI [Casimicrobiaceae bacterium]